MKTNQSDTTNSCHEVLQHTTARTRSVRTTAPIRAKQVRSRQLVICPSLPSSCQSSLRVRRIHQMAPRGDDSLNTTDLQTEVGHPDCSTFGPKPDRVHANKQIQQRQYTERNTKSPWALFRSTAGYFTARPAPGATNNR